MTAIATLLLAFVRPGDVVVHSGPLYAATESIINKILPQFGTQYIDFPAGATREELDEVMTILGGGIYCWIDLDIPPLTFVQRLQEVIPITDVWVGLIKAPVFGFVIALVGCFQGMLVEGDAEQVGLRTTNAVVQAIFMVIVIDAVFAVFFSSIGWI